jgi:hypothetical protein
MFANNVNQRIRCLPTALPFLVARGTSFLGFRSIDTMKPDASFLVAIFGYDVISHKKITTKIN